MQRSIHSNVASYNLSSGQSFPHWLRDQQPYAQKKNHDYRHVELLQDFEMPTTCQKLWQTRNGTYIFLSGGYPPQIKCFDVNELSVKFTRHTKEHILDGLSLSDDYTRFVLMLEGRWLEFHTQGGIETSVRFPMQGRQLGFNHQNGELLLAGASSEVSRLNLTTGSFMAPYATGEMNGVNALVTVPDYNLDLAGGANNRVYCYSSQCSKKTDLSTGSSNSSSCMSLMSSVGSVQIPEDGIEVTALASDLKNPYHFAVGTSSGNVHLFDLRSSHVLLTKNHYSSLPISHVEFFSAPDETQRHLPFVISADAYALRIWNRNDGGNFTSLECPHTIRSVLSVRSGHNMVAPFANAEERSGLLLCATEAPHGDVRFVPSLGRAPKWCSFLDTLTEELDSDDKVTIYEDYTFLNRSEWLSLGLDEQAVRAAVEQQTQEGTRPQIRAVAHGYFVEEKFLRDLKAVIRPSEKISEHLTTANVLNKDSSSLKSEVSKLTKSQRQQLKKDPITYPLPRKHRREKNHTIEESALSSINTKSGQDARFSMKKRKDKDLFALDADSKNAVAQRRAALHESMFETPDENLSIEEKTHTGKSSKKQLKVSALRRNVDFHKSENVLVKQRNRDILLQSKPLEDVSNFYRQDS